MHRPYLVGRRVSQARNQQETGVDLLLNVEDVVNTFLRNVGGLLPDYKTILLSYAHLPHYKTVLGLYQPSETA
jgi:hypothetical protein